MAEMNTERFITEIFNRPPIWMSKHPHHKYKPVIKRLWDEVHQYFPTYDVVQLKKKWKNIKDSYRKELKKNQNSRFGNMGLGDEDCMPQWKYFNLMTFLKEELIPAEDEINLTDNEDQHLDNTLFELQSTLAPSSPQPAQSEETDSRKRKINDLRTEFLEIERKKVRMLEYELKKNRTRDVEKTEDYYYLMSILPEMRKLSPIQKMRVRNKINQIIMEEMVLNTLGNTSVDYDVKPQVDIDICNPGMQNFNQINP